MITSTRTLACLAVAVALLLGASRAAELDDAMDAMNATMDMNMTMGNDTTNLDMMDMIGKDLESGASYASKEAEKGVEDAGEAVAEGAENGLEQGVAGGVSQVVQQGVQEGAQQVEQSLDGLGRRSLAQQPLRGNTFLNVPPEMNDTAGNLTEMNETMANCTETDTDCINLSFSSIGKGIEKGVSSVGKAVAKPVEDVGKGALQVGKGAVDAAKTVGEGAEAVGKVGVEGVETVGKGAETVGKIGVEGVETVGKAAMGAESEENKVEGDAASGLAEGVEDGAKNAFKDVENFLGGRRRRLLEMNDTMAGNMTVMNETMANCTETDTDCINLSFSSIGKGIEKGASSVGNAVAKPVEDVGKGAEDVGKGAVDVGEGAVDAAKTVGEGAEDVGKAAMGAANEENKVEGDAASGLAEGVEDGAKNAANDVENFLGGRRSLRKLLDGGTPLTVEGSNTTTSLGDELEGLLPEEKKNPPPRIDVGPLAKLEAEAPAFENAPSGVAGVDFAAGPGSSTSQVPAPSGEASPAEGGVGGGMPMNDTMAGNMTMDAPTEMANDTINEAPDMAGVEMPPVTDLDGRRRRMRMRMRRRSLAQFEGLENAVNDAVGRVEDFGKQVLDKVQEVGERLGSRLNDTVATALNKTEDFVGRANDTIRAGVGRVNDFVSNITDRIDNRTGANGTEMAADAIPADDETLPMDGPVVAEGPCCMAATPECLACSQGMTVEQYCEDFPSDMCPGKRRKLLQDQPPTDTPTDTPESITGGDSETPPTVPETPDAPDAPSTKPIGDDDTDAGDEEDDDDDAVGGAGGALNGTEVVGNAPPVNVTDPRDMVSNAASSDSDEPVVIQIGSDPPGQLIYDPAAVTIPSGTTVVWTNVDGIPHDVVFDGVPDGADKDALSHTKLFDTIGENVTSTFTVPGEYTYYCSPHLYAGMLATITVTE